MKKIAIPAILAATVLVAGVFALMPVEKASTVHTTILAGQVLATPNAKSQVSAVATTYTWTSTSPMKIVGIKAVEAVSAAHTTTVITIASIDGAAIATAAATATTATSGGAAVTYLISEGYSVATGFESSVIGAPVFGAGWTLPLNAVTSFSITKVNTASALTVTDTVTLITQGGGTITAS